MASCCKQPSKTCLSPSQGQLSFWVHQSKSFAFYHVLLFQLSHSIYQYVYQFCLQTYPETKGFSPPRPLFPGYHLLSASQQSALPASTLVPCTYNSQGEPLKTKSDPVVPLPSAPETPLLTLGDHDDLSELTPATLSFVSSATGWWKCELVKLHDRFPSQVASLSRLYGYTSFWIPTWLRPTLCLGLCSTSPDWSLYIK